MGENSVKLTIIILDYMKAARILENIQLLKEQEADFGVKIIVIDNSCNEENAKILRDGLANRPEIELVINEKNLGYIKAHNVVSDKIEGKFVLVLNPDILLREKDALGKMVEYLENNPDVGMIGPKQVNDTGEIAMTVRAWPNLFLQVARRTFLRHISGLKKKVEYDEMRHLDYSKIQDVDWLQSSCVLIRKKLWDEIGGFDEDYFLFMSDPEICWQVWKKGFRVVYYPEVKVFADGKRVSAGGFATFFKNWVLRQHVKDSLRYNLKHLFRGNPRIK